MKAIMVMFDSLNRHYLPPYGNTDVHAPNFARLAQKATTFESSYVCSMPCMPARRDLHTGRPNFLHRAWGQLEPFDDSVPQMLKNNGIYSHLTSDHLPLLGRWRRDLPWALQLVGVLSRTRRRFVDAPGRRPDFAGEWRGAPRQIRPLHAPGHHQPRDGA